MTATTITISVVVFVAANAAVLAGCYWAYCRWFHWNDVEPLDDADPQPQLYLVPYRRPFDDDEVA